MPANLPDCHTADRLLGRWYDGQIDPEDATLYEQHLLQCPPCLVENQWLRAALHALQDAATGAASP